MEPSTTQTQRWTVGAVTITSVVEEQTDGIPPEFFFPDATADSVQRHAWLVPDYADERGHVSLRVQALVIEDGERRILVDPCVGNGKLRELPWWNQQSWPFMERLLEAGFKPESIDQVLHTHLHADHLGWDTQLEDGVWVPTFVNARHLYTGAALDNCRRESTQATEGGEDIYADSVAPIVEAGLADVVAEDAQLGGRLRLEPTGGHSPGHVSLWVESDGETALVTGDVIHHPAQCAEPTWGFISDDDVYEARATRRRLLKQAADRGALVVGTHFPTRPAGRLVPDGEAWRFEAVAG